MKFKYSILVIVLIGFISISNTVMAQAEWQNFAVDFDATHGQQFGDYLWVGTQAGLSKINIDTKESQTFNAGNSELPSLGFSFKVISDGRLWLFSHDQIGIFDEGVFDPIQIEINRYYSTSIPIYIDSEDNAYISYIDKDQDVINLKITLDGEITHLPHEVLCVDSKDRIWSMVLGIGPFDQDYITVDDGNDILEYYFWNSSLVSSSLDVDQVIPVENTVFIIEKNFEAVGNYISFSYKFHTYIDGEWKNIGTHWVDEGQVIDFIGIDDNTLVFSVLPESTVYRIENGEKESISFQNYNSVRQIAETSVTKWWFYIQENENHRIHIYNPAIGEGSLEQIELTDVNMPNNGISDIHVDVNNEIWVATSGLSHFDGIGWRNFKDKLDSIISFSGIAEDGNGNLWFSIRNAIPPLFKYNRDSDEFESIPVDCSEPVNSSIFSNLFIDESDNIWTWTNCGLSKFDSTNWEYFDSTNSPIIDIKAHRIRIGRDGKFYFYRLNNLYVHNGEAIQVIETPDPTASVRFVYEDSSHRVWLSQGDYFGYYIGENFQNVEVNIQGSEIPQIYNMSQDSKGVYWLATDSGLLRYDGTSWQFRNDGLPTSGISKVTIDYFDNVLVSSVGITAYNENGITNLGGSTISSTDQSIDDNCAIQISPNPTSTNTTITLPADFIGGNYSIYHQNGILITKGNVKKTDFILNSDSMQAGIYIIRAEHDDKSCVGKMIVIH